MGGMGGFGIFWERVFEEKLFENPKQKQTFLKLLFFFYPITSHK